MQAYQKRRIAPNAVDRFKGRLRELTSRTRGVSVASGALEESLVQNMANAQYQIEPARAIENNILQIGAIDFAAEHEADFETKNLAHTAGLVESFKANATYLDLISRYTTRYTREYLQLQTRLREAQRDRLQPERLRHEQKNQRHNQDFANCQQATVGRTTTSDHSDRTDHSTRSDRYDRSNQTRASGEVTHNQSHTRHSGFVPQTVSGSPANTLPASASPKTIREIAAKSGESNQNQAA